MSPARRLAEEAHRSRAARHLVVASALESAGDEWAAVPMFYCAYHHVKASLMADPIWADAARRQAINVDLTPDDRFSRVHKGRKLPGGLRREWGLNELVYLLYPAIRVSYDRLHVASNDVRYHEGLPDGALPDLRVAIDHIVAEANAGNLQA